MRSSVQLANANRNQAIVHVGGGGGDVDEDVDDDRRVTSRRPGNLLANSMTRRHPTLTTFRSPLPKPAKWKGIRMNPRVRNQRNKRSQRAASLRKGRSHDDRGGGGDVGVAGAEKREQGKEIGHHVNASMSKLEPHRPNTHTHLTTLTIRKTTICWQRWIRKKILTSTKKGTTCS